VFLLRSPEARRGHDAAAVTVPPLKFNVRQSFAPRVGPVGSGNASGNGWASPPCPPGGCGPSAPTVWALDFQFDITSHGRTPKLLHVVDEYTREALAMRVARSIDADHTTRVLDQIVRERGAGPELVRMDNGPEMTANALREWCRFSGAERSFIEPGSLWQNRRGVVRLPRLRRGVLGRGVRLGDRGAHGH
jgi:transposase InsO family protein